jgi:hypothetical protein
MNQLNMKEPTGQDFSGISPEITDENGPENTKNMIVTPVFTDASQPTENQPPAKKAAPKRGKSWKKVGLKQMMQKRYQEVHGMSPEMKASLGDIEDAFDALAWGQSSNGKTNFCIQMMVQICLALKCRANYISWEEGHGKSFRDALLRQRVYDQLGNNMEIMDGGTFEEIKMQMAKNKSAKVWVIDSIQASGWTADQYAELKKRFVQGRKKKIFIVISWAQGKLPKGATADSIRFYANIKIPVEKFIAFPSGRYGGNKNYVIWEEGAKKKWGLKLFNKHKNS